jgi:hypothetical protein
MRQYLNLFAWAQFLSRRCLLNVVRIERVYMITLLQLIKAALMLCTVLSAHETTLIMIGDAVASFLEQEDPTTKNMCLLSLKDIRKKGYQAGSKVWKNNRFIWRERCMLETCEGNDLVTCFEQTFSMIFQATMLYTYH